MDHIGPFFQCAKCKALYAADHIRHGTPGLDVDQLREKWHDASEKLFSLAMEKFDKLSIPFEAMEFERPQDYKQKQLAEIKALSAYLNAKQSWDFWGVPDALITIKSKGGHRLECASHHPDPKKHE